jgi:chemotaxis protein CheY-P-specific phosphatase CheC
MLQAHMALQIPKEYLPAIGKILKLSDAAVEELINAMSSATITAEAAGMAEKITESVPSIPYEDLVDIVQILYSLYHVREFSEVRPARFVRDLVETLLLNPDFGISKSDASPTGKRFQRLLNVKTLNTLSKAIRLQRDAEHIYCEAKIISDIRPVFGDNVKQRPLSAVITHTLKLGYDQLGEHKEFFIVLDEEDLGALQSVVERAKAKGQTLTEILNAARIPRLGI